MFGFLRSLDGQLIGNQALWDQHLAIKWVHGNIGAFYGNPDDITIFGESGGSVGSLYQAIYPGIKGLFTRVIAQSGLPTAYFGSQVSNAEHFIEQTKCAQNKTDALNCLLSLSPDELHVDHGTLTSMPFRPTIDGGFVKGTPQEIILGNDVAFSAERDFFGSLDIVFGVNNLEGGTFLLFFFFFFFVYLEGDTFYFPVHGRKWGRGSTTSSYTNRSMLQVKHILLLFSTISICY